MECTKKMNHKFRFMENDLYNLIPVVEEIAGTRHKFKFEIIPEKAPVEKEICGLKISGQIAEPPEAVRGDIARTYFYMDRAYPRKIIKKGERALLEDWSAADPVDAGECGRCKKIEKIQGNSNPFVKAPCMEAGLW